MQSEALRNLRTMRQITTRLDLARGRKVRTTNSLSRIKEESEHLASLTDWRLEAILLKERRRFAAQQTAVERSQGRVLRIRERLAMTINRNRALAELRHELQRARWGVDDLPAIKASLPKVEPSLRQIELKY